MDACRASSGSFLDNESINIKQCAIHLARPQQKDLRALRKWGFTFALSKHSPRTRTVLASGLVEMAERFLEC